MACVTVKDKRVISSAAWQRSELSRVQAALTQHASPGDNSLVLIKPLTIACFVNVTSWLLKKIVFEKYNINVSNYVNKLPHTMKKLLYPGVVSKSWLKTVNTPHTFPHALALIGYLVDLTDRLNSPVSEEWLYVDHDEASKLFQNYQRQCYNCFIKSLDTEPIDNEYIENMKSLLCMDESKIQAVKKEMEELRSILEDPADQAARSEEARQVARLEELRESIRAMQRQGPGLRERELAQERRAVELEQRRRELIAVGEGMREHLVTLDRNIAQQDMTSEEMDRVLEQVNETVTVIEGKRHLLSNVLKITESVDSKLQTAKKTAMDKYVCYNQKLIELGSNWHCPQFVVDERSLAEKSTVSALKQICETLASKVLELQSCQQNKTAVLEQKRKYLAKMEAECEEMKSKLAADQEHCEETLITYQTRIARYKAEIERLQQRMEELRAECCEDETRIATEQAFLEEQDALWRAKLSELAERKPLKCREFKLVINKRIVLAQDVLTCASEQLQLLDARRM